MTHSNTKSKSLWASAGDIVALALRPENMTHQLQMVRTQPSKKLLPVLCEERKKLIKLPQTNISVGIRKWVQ